MAALEIQNLDGDAVLARYGQAMLIDQGQNAVIVAGDFPFQELDIYFIGEESGLLRVRTEEGKVEFPGGVQADSRTVISGIDIGYISYCDGYGIGFELNANATAALIQLLVRSLTYQATSENTDPAPASSIELYIGDSESNKTFVNMSIRFNEDPNDPNEAPTGLDLAGSSIREGAEVGAKVGDLSATDAAGTILTYSLLDDAGGRFAIGRDGRSIVVANGTLLDYETAQAHVVKVQVSDGDLTAVKEFTIKVQDVDERSANPNKAPIDLNLTGASIRESAAAGSRIGDLSATDTEGGTLTFTLLDDAGGRFAMGPDGRSIVVANGLLLDYEQARLHRVTVKVTDGGGLGYTEAFTISVEDVGAENIRGSSADDVLFGGASKDTLQGHLGNDILVGGIGNDVLSGGAGRDTFVFDTAPNKRSNADKITDWSAKDDTIQLENAVFRKLKKTGVLQKAHFAIGAEAKDANDFIGYDKATGNLWYDANGSKSGGQVVFAHIGKNKAVGAVDFLVT